MDKFLRHFDIETYSDELTIELTCRLCGSGARLIDSYNSYAPLEDIMDAASSHYDLEHSSARA